MKLFDPSQIIDDIPVYAPALISQSDTFTSGAHEQLVKFESNYFWFTERRNLIYYLIKKYAAESTSYCEVGCGGAYILSSVKNVIPNARLYGTEIFLQGLKIARKRQAGAKYFQADILNFPYKDEFDLIGIYDVIEHIDDDQKAIKSIYDALTPGGIAIITVPQHMRLWTEHDKYSCHKRRYSRRELNDKCKHAGFEIIRTTSYTSLLLPVFILNNLLNRKEGIDEKTVLKQFEISSLMNGLFKTICKLELIFTKVGINFRFGGSLICIIRK